MFIDDIAICRAGVAVSSRDYLDDGDVGVVTSRMICGGADARREERRRLGQSKRLEAHYLRGGDVLMRNRAAGDFAAAVWRGDGGDGGDGGREIRVGGGAGADIMSGNGAGDNLRGMGNGIGDAGGGGGHVGEVHGNGAGGGLAATVATAAVMVLRLREGAPISADYLAWALNCAPAQAAIKRGLESGVLRVVSARRLAEVAIPAPPAAEQERLARLEMLLAEYRRNADLHCLAARRLAAARIWGAA